MSFYCWSLSLNMFWAVTIHVPSISYCIGALWASSLWFGLSQCFIYLGQLKEFVWNGREANMNTTQNEGDCSHPHRWHAHNYAEPKICLNRMQAQVVFCDLLLALVSSRRACGCWYSWVRQVPPSFVSGLGRVWVQFLFFRHLREVCRGSPGSICSVCQWAEHITLCRQVRQFIVGWWKQIKKPSAWWEPC